MTFMAPISRFSNLPEARRTEILDAAATEIVEHGLSGSSINRVIVRAGLSKSSFYHYFEGKDDLYAAVAQRALDQLLEAMVPPRLPEDSEEYWETWESMYVGFLRRQLVDPTLAALNWSAIEARADGSAHPAIDILAKQMRQWLEALLAQGQMLGAVRSDLPFDLLLDAVFGMLEGGDRWFARHWNDISEQNFTENAKRIVALLRDLAAPRILEEET